MLLAHKIRLAPNNAQATYFARAAGTARFAYNWALARWQELYQASLADPAQPKPNEAALRRELNTIKRDQFPWMPAVTKNAPQLAVIQLGQAFDNFFARRASFPVFRRKGVNDRFTLTSDQFRVEDKRIRIPKLGWVRMRETLRFTGHIVSATVCRVAGHWYASITVDLPDGPPCCLPKTKARWAWTWVSRRWPRCPTVKRLQGRSRCVPCSRSCKRSGAPCHAK